MSSAGGALRATRIVGEAWRSVWASLAATPQTYAAALVFYVVIAVALWKLGWQPRPAYTLSDFLLFRLVRWGHTALLSVSLVPLALAVYRFILRGETDGRRIVARPALMFWLWMILFQGLEELAGLTVRFAGSPTAVGEIMIAAGLTYYLLTARLILIFPATAIDAPAGGALGRLRASWEQTRGHYGLIVRAGLLMALPLLGLFVLTSFAVVLAMLSSNPRALETQGFLAAVAWLGIAGRAIYSVLSTAILAAMTAWIYRSVAQDDAVVTVFE